MNSRTALVLAAMACRAGSAAAEAPANIEDVIRKQRENEARYRAEMAPTVKRQTEINYSRDPAGAGQLFDAWKGAEELRGEAAAEAARAVAARGAATDPAEREAQNEKTKTALGRLRGAQAATEEVIDHVTGLINGQAGPEKSTTTAAGANRGPIVLPTAEDALQLYGLKREELDGRRDDAVLRKADAIRAALEAAADNDLEKGTAPGTRPGTRAERFLKAVQDEYDGGRAGPKVDFPREELRDAVGARGVNPAEIQALIGQLSACHARIADHNGRKPNPPSSLSDADFQYWNPIIEAYNDEARALEEEQSNILNRLNAVSP
jgi:hypothetical protein